MRESRMCGTDLPKCREKKTLAGAFDTQAQDTATLDIPPPSRGKTDCWPWLCGALRRLCQRRTRYRVAHGIALLERFRSCQVHHHPANPTAWAQQCESDGKEDFLM
jgi:hypothetical protein